jgi:hypothetical protein
MSMGDYLAREVPHYFQEPLQSYQELERVNLELDKDLVLPVIVYEVVLGSGKRIYACEGGLPNFKANNVYAAAFPDPATAAKFHVYTLLKMLERQNPDMKGSAEEFADFIELPIGYRQEASKNKA